MPETVVVIPPCNERDNIVGLLPEVLAATDCHVVVVDDDSPDGTAQVVATPARQTRPPLLPFQKPSAGLLRACRALPAQCVPARRSSTGVFGHTPSPPTTRSAASLSAWAQEAEIFGFLPFAARTAFASACLSAFFARLRSFRACFAGPVLA